MIALTPLPVELKPCRKLVDYGAMCRYAELSRDPNPIHTDRQFAAASPLGGLIAHGTMSLSLVWQSLAASLGDEAIGTITLDVRFVRPVRENDIVTSGGRRRADCRIYDVWVANGSGELVIVGTAELDTFSSKRGPNDAVD